MLQWLSLYNKKRTVNVVLLSIEIISIHFVVNYLIHVLFMRKCSVVCVCVCWAKSDMNRWNLCNMLAQLKWNRWIKSDESNKIYVICQVVCRKFALQIEFCHDFVIAWVMMVSIKSYSLIRVPIFFLFLSSSLP